MTPLPAFIGLSMRDNRPSETALKVALTMVTLAKKAGWADRLPPGTAELSEKLILAAKAFGYNRSLMRMSKRPWMIALYDQADRIMPGIFEGLGERKIFMNDAVLRAIADGFRQVLVLGAGFDTLCLRLAPDHPDVRFFEIDHPATATAKRRGVADVGQPRNLTLIASNLAEEDMVSVLDSDARWDSAARTIIVMEGLLYYLPADDVTGVFDRAHRATGAGSRVAFSHIVSERHDGWAQPLLRLIGEPWLSRASVEDLPDYIGTGWHIVRSERPAIRNPFEGFALAEKETDQPTETNS